MVDTSQFAAADRNHARVELRERLAATPVSGRDDNLEDRTLLVFEELASNGSPHAGSPFCAEVSAQPTAVLLDVSKRAVNRAPAPDLDRDPSRGGLGLLFIARLYGRYGWHIREDRKHVWGLLEGRTLIGDPLAGQCDDGLLRRPPSRRDLENC